MAVLKLKSLEQADDYRGKPQNDHSKVRLQYFKLAPVTEAGDANTTLELCTLPPGAVRIIPEMSRLQKSAWGAARVLKIGHKEYIKGDSGTTAEPADDDAFAVNLDMAAAGFLKFGDALGYDVYSKDGVVVEATVTGGTIPIGATLFGYIAYTYE